MTIADYIAIGVLVVLALWFVATQFLSWNKLSKAELREQAAAAFLAWRK